MTLSDKIAISAAILSFSGFTIKGTIVYVDTKKEKMKTVLKNPYIRTFAGTLFLSIVAAFIPWDKIHVGEIKPKVIHDTVRVMAMSNLFPIKTETPKQIVKPKRSVKKELASKIIVKSKPDTSKKIPMPNNNGIVSTGANAHIVGGTGNQVGVNGDQYNGVKQRHLNDAVILYLSNAIPDKNKKITFLISGGKEGLIYAQEILNGLIQNGYKNISLTPANWMDPDGYDKVYVHNEVNEAQIRVCPASNVQ